MAQTTTDQLEKMAKLLNLIRRDAEQIEDYEVADSISRTANYALELLDEYKLSLEVEVEVVAA